MLLVYNFFLKKRRKQKLEMALSTRILRIFLQIISGKEISLGKTIQNRQNFHTKQKPIVKKTDAICLIEEILLHTYCLILIKN